MTQQHQQRQHRQERAVTHTLLGRPGIPEQFRQPGERPAAMVDREALIKVGLMPRKAKHLKVLGDGELAKKITVRAHAFSKSAQEKITKAGGAVEVIQLHPRKDAGAEAPASK